MYSSEDLAFGVEKSREFMVIKDLNTTLIAFEILSVKVADFKADLEACFLF